ncbi:hypothetical protein NYO67_4457 [Aspergillus flavus]|nr:hypothetical protein NYO67_4457 [Aspergillus flavus]
MRHPTDDVAMLRPLQTRLQHCANEVGHFHPISRVSADYVAAMRSTQHQSLETFSDVSPSKPEEFTRLSEERSETGTPESSNLICPKCGAIFSADNAAPTFSLLAVNALVSSTRAMEVTGALFCLRSAAFFAHAICREAFVLTGFPLFVLRLLSWKT